MIFNWNFDLNMLFSCMKLRYMIGFEQDEINFDLKI